MDTSSQIEQRMDMWASILAWSVETMPIRRQGLFLVKKCHTFLKQSQRVQYVLLKVKIYFAQVRFWTQPKPLHSRDYACRDFDCRNFETIPPKREKPQFLFVGNFTQPKFWLFPLWEEGSLTCYRDDIEWYDLQRLHYPIYSLFPRECIGKYWPAMMQIGAIQYFPSRQCTDSGYNTSALGILTYRVVFKSSQYKKINLGEVKCILADLRQRRFT